MQKKYRANSKCSSSRNKTNKMKSKLKLKLKKRRRKCVYTIFMDEKFVVHFWSAFLVMHGNGGDGYRLIVHTVGHEEGRGSGSWAGQSSGKAVESVKMALGCVETGFVDSVRRWKCLKNGILMQRIYNLRLSMSPNWTRRAKSCASQTTLFTNSGILGS